MGKSKLDELREHYDTADMSDSIARATRDDRTIDPDEVLVSTSIRLPNSLMKRVRQRADAAGIPVTTLMRQWITDRLDMTNDAVVPVSEIERLIAERSRPAA